MPGHGSEVKGRQKFTKGIVFIGSYVKTQEIAYLWPKGSVAVCESLPQGKMRVGVGLMVCMSKYSKHESQYFLRRTLHIGPTRQHKMSWPGRARSGKAEALGDESAQEDIYIPDSEWTFTQHGPIINMAMAVIQAFVAKSEGVGGGLAG